MVDSGVYRGIVVKVNDGQVFVEVAALGVGRSLGPCMCVGDYSVGDNVVVAILGGNMSDVAILTLLKRPSPALITYAKATAAVEYTTTLIDVYELVDASHLTVTFDAPSSGKVLVRISCIVVLPYGTAGIGIHNGSSVIADYPITTAGGSILGPVSIPLVITGLTAGATYTYKLAFKGAPDQGSMTIDATDAPAVMEVWEA